MTQDAFSARYARQTMLPEVGAEGQRRLSAASVLLVGCGGLGSVVALYLAAAGVGRLGIVDGDTVSESNLQRQVLYSTDEVGKAKTACAKRRLGRLNPLVEVEAYDMFLTAENSRQIISKYDMVVDGSDNFATRYLIDDVCHALGKAYIYGSIGAFGGQVSVFDVAGAGRYADLYPEREALESAAQGVKGVVGVTPAIIGAIEAAEAVKLIVGCGEALVGRLLTFDVLSMRSQVIDI